MLEEQKRVIVALLILSFVFVLIPIVTAILRSTGKFRNSNEFGAATFSKKLILFSAFLIMAIWCLRYSVGYYSILLSADAQGVSISCFEEILNSLIHALQTFSMDEDYTQYLLDGKEMITALGASQDSFLYTAYGIYASVLNFIAPLAGGAILFEILASIFPRIKLKISYFEVWREKYYFSELNENSLALARSIFIESRDDLKKPILIFTDVYIDDESEKESEMLLEAKFIGAICVSDDLTHISKNKFGKRKFFLIDKNETENLQTLTNLANIRNCECIKGAEIYVFSQDESYNQIEANVRNILINERNFGDTDFPVFIPIQIYRNLVTNMLVDLPLYEPIINKKTNSDGTVDLNVTIIGAGSLGEQMFLSVYWFGQLLDCRLNINVVSLESEAEWRGRIDFINPEIYQTTIEHNPILKYNRKGDYSEPYCNVRYYQADVHSNAFLDYMYNTDKGTELLDTDYFLVATGSDEDNIEIANKLRKCIGNYHIKSDDDLKTIIAYVVYNFDLCNTLNHQNHYYSYSDDADIFMKAVGSLDDVYSVRNIFMTEHSHMAQLADAAYQSRSNRKKRAEIHGNRLIDDYKYWASLARGMHIKYKVFSLRLYNNSVFDKKRTENFDEARKRYKEGQLASFNEYKRFVNGNIWLFDEADVKKYKATLNRMQWLEHRRWCAFTRINGFQSTSDYESYFGGSKSYKHMSIKLHPCLVECDSNGIRAEMDNKGKVLSETTLKCEDKSNFDFLDELSYKLNEIGYNQYDFKIYDYPLYDFE